ncbi:MAG: immunoglobulin domain-containing protein, partial [Bacteroidota bacterium]|nr:immunoglobulin domain-containing protein [Bacteroidota bacterium]
AVFGVSAVGSNLNYQWKKDGIAISDGTDVLGSTTATLTLSKLTPGAAAPYTCDVTGTCGDETTSSVLLTVKDVSAFTTQPVSASKCEGDVTSFTVVAAGAKTYQWSKDGNALTDISGKISGSTTDHLVINSLVAGDAGTYQCAVTGDCGNALSTAVSLTVSQNAKIIDEPVSASKCNGESVLFSVNASGTALTYQWKKNGADLTDGTNISGSQTKDLNISNLTDVDAGTYDCVISSPCTTVTTSLVNLTVKTSPKIDIQPLSTSVKTGTPFTLTINATGTNLKYQWQKDGTNLTDDISIQGSNTNMLTLTNSDSTDAGSYRCVVNGDCGVATSDPAVIQIIEDTKITNQSATQVLCEGNTVTLFVTAKGTDMTYNWKKNGIVLSDITGKLSGSHTANLTIQAIDSTDKAVYSCVVSGKGGTVTSNLIQLAINNNTVITSQPLSMVTNCEGTNVVLAISASSAQTYQWYKGNNIVSNSVNISGATTNTLNINSVTLADAGSYYCKVTGLCGELTSNPSALIVNGNPVTPGTITGQSQVCQGSTLIDYQVPSITYASDYEWAIPMNARIVSGDHTSHIKVLFPLNSATGAQIIKVRGKNSCAAGPWSADFKVSINTPPNSYAGLDQNICDITTALQGSKVPAGGAGAWNLISGSLYFADKTLNTSTVSSVAQGDNVLSWTVTLNGCSTTDTVRIRNNQLTVDAGLDKTTCSSTVTMDGSIVPSGANGSWYVVSGSGAFNSSSSSDAIISRMGFGTNKFSWVLTQNGCISSDTVTVFNNIPDTPLAGNDQNVCSTETVLNANKPSHGAGRWTVFSGAGYFDNAADPAAHIRSLSRGKNILTWTITNQNCSLTDTVVVSNNLPEANAGFDQVLCDSRSTLAANPPLTGNKGQWSVASGSATFLDYSSSNTQVAGLNKGSNKLVWSILSGICVSTDTLELVNNAPTVAYAGPDQSVIGPTTTLAANSPVVGTGKWTVISGSAGFANDTLCSTKVVGLDPGINELRWTITNKGCSSYSEVMITNGAVETVEAGDNQTVCANYTQLKATQPQYGFGVWTVKKGSAKFTNNQLYNTQVTNLAPGKNILTWTVSLNGVSFSDTVTITNNQPTTSVVGKQIYICSDTTILTGNNPVYGTGKWTLEGGSAVIANDKVYNSKVTYLGYGDNLFRWTITNGTCISSSVLTITNNNPTPAEAGPDMTICSDSTQLIPNNPSIGVGEWSVLKGSGDFTGNIVQGLSVGTNVLRWSIKNATCVSTDDVVVVSNKPTTANAGTQAVICTDSMSLTANKPNTLIGEYGRWTVLNGAGTFADSTSSTSLVRDLALGVNNLRWTITNKTCSSSSDVAINYSSVKAIAGSDITSCDNHVYLNANNPGSGTGEWSVVGGSGSAHFVNSSSPNTQVTNLDYGVNTLRWTITNKGCASYSEVKVTNDAPSTSYAGGNRNVCDNSVALAATPVVIGRGTWSVLSGSGTFSDSHASNASVSNIGSGIN